MPMGWTCTSQYSRPSLERPSAELDVDDCKISGHDVQAAAAAELDFARHATAYKAEGED